MSCSTSAPQKCRCDGPLTKNVFILRLPESCLFLPVALQQHARKHHFPHGHVRPEVQAQPPKRQVSVFGQRRKDQLPTQLLDEIRMRLRPRAGGRLACIGVMSIRWR